MWTNERVAGKRSDGKEEKMSGEELRQRESTSMHDDWGQALQTSTERQQRVREKRASKDDGRVRKKAAKRQRAI